MLFESKKFCELVQQEQQHTGEKALITAHRLLCSDARIYSLPRKITFYSSVLLTCLAETVIRHEGITEYIGNTMATRILATLYAIPFTITFIATEGYLLATQLELPPFLSEVKFLKDYQSKKPSTQSLISFLIFSSATILNFFDRCQYLKPS